MARKRDSWADSVSFAFIMLKLGFVRIGYVISFGRTEPKTVSRSMGVVVSAKQVRILDPATHFTLPSLTPH